LIVSKQTKLNYLIVGERGGEKVLSRGAGYPSYAIGYISGSVSVHTERDRGLAAFAKEWSK